MKQKLLNIASKLKALSLKAYAAAPLLTGVVVGYVFKPELKMILDAGMAIVKGLIKL